MTNAEYYLIDEVDVEKIAREIDIILQNDVNIANAEQATIKYFNSTCKPTLTEDERAILRNIDKKFKSIKRANDSYLYLVMEDNAFRDIRYEFEVFPNLFQFIKNGEEYEIAELLKGE